MNRIYQGKVSSVEIRNPEKKASPGQQWLLFHRDVERAAELMGRIPALRAKLDPEITRRAKMSKDERERQSKSRELQEYERLRDEQKQQWQSALWQHHELFQALINYNFAGFAVMIDEDAGDAALTTFRRAVVGCWRAYSGRQGQWSFPFIGTMRALGLPDGASFEQFATALYQRTGTRSSTAQRHAAVRHIFRESLAEAVVNGEAERKVTATWREAWESLKVLCSPQGQSGTTPPTVSYQQEMRARDVALRVADGGTISIEEAYYFKASPEHGAWTAKQTRSEIEQRYTALAAEYPELSSDRADFEQWLKTLLSTFRTEGPGGKAQGDFDVALLLALRPQSLGLRQIFLRKTEWRRKKVPEPVESDPVGDARVGDTPVFPFFTNLSCAPKNSKKPPYVVWEAFEKQALIEVFTKISQFLLECRRRSTELDRLQARVAELDELFSGDKRMDLLQELVVGLGGSKVDDRGQPLPYRIRARSLKAWPRLREKWRELCAESNPTADTLLGAKKALQKKLRERFGNATLYDHLALPSYRSIWLDEAPHGKSSRPLENWAEYTECKEDIKHLESDPAFTPAHPDNSPRFFRWSETLNKEHEQWDGKSHFTFIADALDFGETKPIPTKLRVHYSAPRLIRDGLRRAKECLDHKNPDCDWLPPMLRALPEFHERAKQSFERVAIRLMPESRTNIQVALEPELDNEGWLALWNESKEVNLWWGRLSRDGEATYRRLKWPAKPDSPEADASWFKRGNVSCVAVDLGINESGACKVLQAVNETHVDTTTALKNSKGKLRFSRSLTPSTYFSQWCCFTLAERLLRLPGENAFVYRFPTERELKGNPKLKVNEMALLPEFSGRRGRRPQAEETQGAKRLFESLEYPIDRFWPIWMTHASFPEQNDELLRALSAARSRLFRLHRWAWMLTADEQRRAACLEEIGQIRDDSPLVTLRSLTSDVAALSEKLKQSAEKHLHGMTEGLVAAANRILPSKRGRLQWVTVGEWHEMRLVENDTCRDTLIAGQRGLSTERLTQLQSLRQLVQSLNHLHRHKFGKRYQIPKRGTVSDPFPTCGEALETAREDRAKQIAHAIFALALGVEIAPPPPDKKQRKQTESLHGVYRKIKGREPVDFIALEDLSKYRTSELRGRRENRQLAAWSHRRIVQQLEQLCEVVGMPLVLVDPAFTSRFSARSGGAGFRAIETKAGDPIISWLKRRANDEDENAAELLCQFQTLPVGRTLLAPRDGGHVFVELRGNDEHGRPVRESKPAYVVHADLNGAHRVGLRALAHPELEEFQAKVWIKQAKKKKGEAKEEMKSVLHLADTTRALGGTIVDARNVPLVRENDALWDRVDGDLAWKRCIEINNARLRSWDDVPMT